MATGVEELMPRLLFLCQNLPFPPDNGVKTRSFNTLRQLAVGFDVTALYFIRQKGSASSSTVDERVAALREYGAAEAFWIEQEGSAGRFIWDNLRSVGTGMVYTRFVYDSRPYSEAVSRALAGTPFDLVHADSLDLAGYFERLQEVPVACTHHDAQSLLLERRALQERNPGVRAYLRFESRLMRAEERRWCPRVALNVVVSDADRRVLADVAPGSRWHVAPNGVDTTFFAPQGAHDHAGDGRTVLFVGGATWFPNLDAMEFFGTHVWPLVRQAVPGARCLWVGRVGEADRKRFEGMGVEVTGYVDDVRPYLRFASCVIAPLRVGGGTRVKILDAWAMGKAVVSTSIGAEGLEARDGCNALIRDDAVSFAAGVSVLLSDPEARGRLGEASRRTAVERYSWDSIGHELRQAYREVIDSGGKRGTGQG